MGAGLESCEYLEVLAIITQNAINHEMRWNHSTCNSSAGFPNCSRSQAASEVSREMLLCRLRSLCMYAVNDLSTNADPAIGNRLLRINKLSRRVAIISFQQLLNLF